MTESLCITFSILLYLASSFMVYKSTRTINIMTPTTLFYVFYTVFIYVGSVIVYLREQNIMLLMTASAGIFFFALGVVSINASREFRPVTELSIYMKSMEIDRWKGEGWAFSYIILIAITLVSTFLYFNIYGFPLLSSEVEMVRLASIRGTDYHIHFVDKVLPFVSLILIGKAHFNKRYGLLAVISAVLTFVALIGTGFRGTVIHFIIMVIFLRQFLSRSTFSIFRVARLSLALSFVIVILSYLRYGGGSFGSWDTLSSVLNLLYYRIILQNLDNLNFILGLFPKQMGFLFGYGYIMDLMTITPGPDVSFSSLITMKMNPLAAESVTMTPTILGELYGNFSMLGVAIGMFMTGYIIQFYYIRFMRSRRSLANVVLYSYVFTFFSKVVMQGWGNTIIINIMPIVVIVIILNTLNFRLQGIATYKRMWEKSL